MMTCVPRILILGILVHGGGCVYIPKASVDRRSSLIGTDAGAPIQMNVTSREEVFSRFGKPAYSTQNDRAWGYLFAMETGKAYGLIFGPCGPHHFGEAETYGEDDVWLEFDERGVLRRCEKQLRSRFGNNPDRAWRTFAKTVPDPVRAEQLLDQSR